jgi:hypothetical protein
MGLWTNPAGDLANTQFLPIFNEKPARGFS